MAYVGAAPWHDLSNRLFPVITWPVCSWSCVCALIHPTKPRHANFLRRYPSTHHAVPRRRLTEAKQLEENRQAAGFDQSASDYAALQGFNNGVFEDNEEDNGTIVEKFFTAIED